MNDASDSSTALGKRRAEGPAELEGEHGPSPHAASLPVYVTPVASVGSNSSASLSKASSGSSIASASSRPSLPRTASLKLAELEKKLAFEEVAAAAGNFVAANFLGEGQFGMVFRGRLPDGRDVAIKVFKSPCDELMVREVDTIVRVAHANVVGCFGWARASGAFPATNKQTTYTFPEGTLCIVYEYISDYTVEEWLGFGERAAPRPLNWHERIRILCDVAEGLAYLHGKSIIHRDLRSANVLVRPDGRAVIADFGLAALLEESGEYATGFFSTPIGYTDPEYITTGVYSAKSDVYGLGVMIMEAVTGERGYAPKRRPRSLVQVVEEARSHAGFETKLADESAGPVPAALPIVLLLQLARECVRLEGAKRPSVTEALGMLQHIAEHIPAPS
eukprot:tig00020603_g11780.t1